jgi:hypothetical protein
MKFAIENGSVQDLIDALLQVKDKSRPVVICLKPERRDQDDVWDYTLVTMDGVDERSVLGTEIVLKQADNLYTFDTGQRVFDDCVAEGDSDK